MVKIVISDANGGVLTASQALNNAFNKERINSSIFNMQDLGKSIPRRIFKTAKILLSLPKEHYIILQHFEPILVGLILSRLGFKKTINVIHTDLVNYYKSSPAFKRLAISLVLFLSKCTLTVFVSNESEIKSRQKFRLKNTTTIYNIFTPPAFQSTKKRTNNKFVLGIVSRIHDAKNIDLAILVVNELKKKFSDIELRIYGDGNAEDIHRLKNLTNTIGAHHFVHFLGFEKNPINIFASIDCLISFSSIEGMPTVILESIGYRVPVFHTDCSSGPREIMARNSCVFNKTSSFEKTSVGYLIKPIQQPQKHRLSLPDIESDYVSFISSFIYDVKAFKFTMDFDNERFNSLHIINQWKLIFESLD